MTSGQCSFFSAIGISFFCCCLMIGQQDNVVINDVVLEEQNLLEFESTYGVRPTPGVYWYDNRSGVFGNIGGPALGILFPGHDIGRLSPTASRGESGVYFNGRQLQKAEAFYIAKIFGYNSPVPGQYWLEANGNIGFKGYALAFGNIYSAIARSHRNRPSNSKNFWSSGLYSGGNYYTGGGGQPSVGYVSVPGYGPIGHGMN